VTGQELRDALGDIYDDGERVLQRLDALARALDGQDLGIPLAEATAEWEDGLDAVRWTRRLAELRDATAPVPTKGAP
jgi:hypothetical protein